MRKSADEGAVSRIETHDNASDSSRSSGFGVSEGLSAKGYVGLRVQDVGYALL